MISNETLAQILEAFNSAVEAMSDSQRVVFLNYVDDGSYTAAADMIRRLDSRSGIARYPLKPDDALLDTAMPTADVTTLPIEFEIASCAQHASAFNREATLNTKILHEMRAVCVMLLQELERTTEFALQTISTNEDLVSFHYVASALGHLETYALRLMHSCVLPIQSFHAGRRNAETKLRVASNATVTKKPSR